MIHKIIAVEIKLSIVLSILLIIINLISQYFIIDLFDYDEILGFSQDGEKRSISVRPLAFFLFIVIAANLLFVSIVLVSKLLK